MTPDARFDLRIACARGAGVVALLGPTSTVIVNGGVGPDRLKRLLARSNRRLSDIDAVLLSNERAERVAGLPALLQRHDVRVFATPGTLRSLSERYAWSPHAVPVTHGEPMLCGDFVVTAFDVPARGTHPVAWRVEGNGVSAVVAVDIATPDRRLAEWMSNLDVLVLEAHYDDALLDRGTADQRRVLPGRGGRLSNADAGRLVARASFQPDGRVVLVDLDPTLNEAGRARRVVQAVAPPGLQVGAIPGHADDVRVRFEPPTPGPERDAEPEPALVNEPGAVHEPGAKIELEHPPAPASAAAARPDPSSHPSSDGHAASDVDEPEDPVPPPKPTAPTGQLAFGFGDD